MSGAAGNGDWTYARLLSWTGEYLARQGVEDARLCGEVLLAHAAGCGRIDLYVRHEQVPAAEVTGRFRELVKRAAGREPIAYLVGEKEFYSLSFAVDSSVLIPRPETETLVDAVLDHCKAAGLDAPRILDVGTGSGCVAVALLTQLTGSKPVPHSTGSKPVPHATDSIPVPHSCGATAVASDVSEAALKMAESNAARHGVGERMRVVRASGLALPADALPEGGFDVIVSNPPYVAAGEMAGLDETVRAYEPEGALTDGGDGLSVYRAIGAGAAGMLAAGGMVAVEIAMGAGDAVMEVMTGGGLVHRATLRDRVGGHERVMVFVGE